MNVTTTYDLARPVVCLDEKRKQLVKETRTGFTDSHGVRHEDYEYERNGVGVLYMVCEPLGGRREVLVEEGQDRLAWARTVTHLAERMYPEAERITLVEDNLSTPPRWGGRTSPRRSTNSTGRSERGRSWAVWRSCRRRSTAVGSTSPRSS